MKSWCIQTGLMAATWYTGWLCAAAAGMCNAQKKKKTKTKAKKNPRAESAGSCAISPW